MNRKLHARNLALVVSVLLLPVGSAWAAMTTLTYSVQASGFLNSNGDSPPAPTSSTLGGIFSFTFDPEGPSLQAAIAPDTVVDFDITRSDGLLIDFDGTNTAARIQDSGVGRRIAFGGITNGEHQMVGLTDPGDFFVFFDVDDTTYQVTGMERASFLTRVDPFYDAGNIDIQLLDVAAVPIPAAFPLMLGALAWLGFHARQRGDA